MDELSDLFGIDSTRTKFMVVKILLFTIGNNHRLTTPLVTPSPTTTPNYVVETKVDTRSKTQIETDLGRYVKLIVLLHNNNGVRSVM